MKKRNRKICEKYPQINEDWSVDDGSDDFCFSDFFSDFEDCEAYWHYHESGNAEEYLFYKAKEAILSGGKWRRVEDLIDNASVEKLKYLSPGLIAGTNTGSDGSYSSENNAYALSAIPFDLWECEKPYEFTNCVLQRAKKHLETFRQIDCQLKSRQPGVLIMILLLSPFWIRPLSSWVAPKLGENCNNKIIFSLVEHLLVRYPIPNFLYRIWLCSNELPTVKWVQWFVLIGQGDSLYKAAKIFNWPISKRFAMYLDKVPDLLNPVEGCMWAEIMRLGGSQTEFERLRRYGFYTIDPTDSRHHVDSNTERESKNGTPFIKFWRKTIHWLIRYREELSDDMSSVILGWAAHVNMGLRVGLSLNEQRYGLFFWKDRKPGKAYQAGLEHQRLCALPYKKYKWKSHGWDWVYQDERSSLWSIRELTSGEDLYKEASAMCHCVSSYALRCVKNHSSIFSIKENGHHRLTVEIEPNTRSIVQIRGAFIV